MKSIVRWAGSKRLLLNELRLYWRPHHTRYVEPFAGSACLFFDVRPGAAILSDLNDDLMNAYRMLRLDAESVIESYRSFSRGKKGFYEVRKMNPSKMTKRSAAARFLYLNRFCFNGLYRTNLKGEFNVPYGPPKTSLNRFEQHVLAAAKALKGAGLFTADFEQTLAGVRAGDFVYLDPPYVVDERRVFSAYLPGSFRRTDLERLASALAEIDRKGATFVVSYEYSDEAKALVKRWNCKFVRTRRNIAGFAGHRRLANELIASNGDI